MSDFSAPRIIEVIVQRPGQHPNTYHIQTSTGATVKYENSIFSEQNPISIEQPINYSSTLINKFNRTQQQGGKLLKNYLIRINFRNYNKSTVCR